MTYLVIGLRVLFRMNLDREIKILIKNYRKHSPETLFYRKLKKSIEKKIIIYFQNYKKQKNLKLGKIATIKFPFFEMGNINSSHLFGIDELIIFCFYYLNKKNYLNSLDLGANIGLHSLIMTKNKMNVTCYEPDDFHIKQMVKNLKINNCFKKVKIKKKAVSNHGGKVKFLRILGNTTGNHIEGSKRKVYGKIEKEIVNCDNFKSIIKGNDFIKMDVEGVEAKLICSTNSEHWINTDAILEIGSFANAKKIFSHCNKIRLNIFSQKKNWKQVNKLKDLPKTYKEGSVFLTCKDNMNWISN